MPGDPAAPNTAPPRPAQVRGWKVFGPGYHKGTLYTADDCRRMGDHFARLSADPDEAERYLTPRVKIGHDDQQRYAASLGLPSFGRVSDCRVLPDGTVELDLDDLPEQLGAAINAGLFRDGSIEIPKPLPDPDDAGKPALHPVLSAVSLLGEEQPAVKGFPPPKATFADGTPVPAASDLTPWLTAMARVAMSFAAESRVSYRGADYPATTVCFSAMTPPGADAMNRDELNKKLAAMYGDDAVQNYAAFSDEQVKKVVEDGEKMSAKFAEDKAKADEEAKKLAAVPPPPPTPPTPSTPAPSSEFAAFAAKFDAYTASCDKRFGDMESALKDLKPKADAGAAMSDRFEADQKAAHKTQVELVVDTAIREGRVTRRDRQLQVDHGMTQSDKQTFSDGPNAGKTAFDVWKTELLSRPKTRFFDETVAGGKPTDAKGGGAMSPLVRRLLDTESVRRQAPAARAQMLAAAGEK